MTTMSPAHLHLTKHHGAGNDFLVFLDALGTTPLGPDLVAALCQRHHGVGADGVIRVLRNSDGGELVMELRNADGGVAETSGNGLRCLAQAAIDAGWARPPSFPVWTDAGRRTVDFEPGPDGTGFAWVDMGTPQLGADAELGVEVEPLAGAVKLARWVDVGNPHLVLVVGDLTSIDVATAGAAIDARRPGGANVEFVTVDTGGDEIDLRVWERGAGETLACGTGSVAAAAAARAAGLSRDRVQVHNPGGTLEVAFTGDEARLGGPVHKVADIDVDVAVLVAATRR
jgi:diaminopimelate epimerase